MHILSFILILFLYIQTESYSLVFKSTFRIFKRLWMRYFFFLKRDDTIEFIFLSRIYYITYSIIIEGIFAIRISYERMVYTVILEEVRCTDIHFRIVESRAKISLSLNSKFWIQPRKFGYKLDVINFWQNCKVFFAKRESFVQTLASLICNK